MKTPQEIALKIYFLLKEKPYSVDELFQKLKIEDILISKRSVYRYLEKLEHSLNSEVETIEIGKFEFICMHYPIASWDGMNNGVPHLHGHCHLPPHHRIAAGKAMDVGVDGNGMEPLSLGEIVTIMESRPIAKLCLPQDHHEKRL